MTAFRNGVNYFDTAYVYPGSEAALGKILSHHHIREKVYIATKLPHYLIKSTEGMEKCFEEQKKRLQTNYIDYYLMHMLTDVKTWQRLKELGIVEWLEQKKKSGEIHQIGFSYHGNSDMFCQLVDAYDWDFAKYNTIIWMNIHRLGEKVFIIQIKKVFLLLSWSRCAAVSLLTVSQKRPRGFSLITL